MKIVSVTGSESKRGKFSVLFDDETEIKASAAQIADLGIYAGREFEDEDFEELRRAIELGASKVKSLRILGNRNLSAGEVKKRLVSKGVEAETAGETVEWLEKIGAINDSEYASMIVQHYISKGYGIARARNELYKRGVPRDIWDDALQGADGFEDAARNFLERKLRGSSDKDDLRKATDALCRRGFSYSEASDAVRRYLESIDE